MAAEDNAAVEPAQVNRPEDTKFKQQKLDAWQPILTPSWVIGTFLLVGAVFVPVGAYLFKLSADLFEQEVTYDSYLASEISPGVPSACEINDINEGFGAIFDETASFGDCQVTFEITQDIPADEEVFLYTQLSNFYQNHRRYVKSVSESQLIDEVNINPISQLSDSALETSCDPSQSFANDDTTGDARIYYPCGLIALSVFNDGISLASFERGGVNVSYNAGVLVTPDAAFNISLDTSDIAWQSDLDNKYKNPTQLDCTVRAALPASLFSLSLLSLFVCLPLPGFTPWPNLQANSSKLTSAPPSPLPTKPFHTQNNFDSPGGNLCPQRYFQYQYLWQTYNQFMCYPLLGNGAPDITSPDPSACVTFTDFVLALGEDEFGAATWASNTAARNNTFEGPCAACTDASFAHVNLGGIDLPLDTSSAQSPEGVRNERFIVWVRTAGLPKFRKLYGKIVPPDGGFRAGDKITLNVVPNFLVKSISGSKALVVGTTSPLGGKNDVLGVAYMTVGTICLFLAVVFFIKQKVNPRRLGDPSYLAFSTNKKK